MHTYSMAHVELEKLLDSTGKEIDITGVALGGMDALQMTNRNIALDTSIYEWDGTTLKLKSDGSEVLKLSDIFNPDNGQIITGDAAIANGTEEKLAILAKAYGYEGSTEEFLALPPH